MAYAIVVMNISDQQVSDLNGRCQFPTKINESLEGCRFLLEAMEAGTLACNVQITITAVNPAIPSPTDPGSTQDSYVK